MLALTLTLADTPYPVLLPADHTDLCCMNFKCLSLKFLHLLLRTNSVEHTGKFSIYIPRTLNSRTVIIMAAWIRKKLRNFVKLFYYPGEFIFAALDVSPAAIDVQADERPSSM